MSDRFGKDPEACENCNVAPEDMEKGHSITETENGFKFDVEHLNDLGMVQENGITLLFDRMNNQLVIERDELSLREIVDELEELVDTEDNNE